MEFKSASVEAVVDQADGNEEGDDDSKGLVHVESHLHDAVVKVGLVGGKHRLAVELAPEGYADDIDAGDEDEGEGDEKGLFAVGKACGFVRHLIFDGEVGDDVAEEEAARVAHEGFETAHFSIHVEEEESEGGTGQADADDAEEVCLQVVVEIGEGTQDEAGEAGGESVDAVDEVHGVDDEEDDEDGEGVADPNGNFVDAEESVQVVYHEVAQGEEQGGDGLDDEFVGGFEALEVVEDANEVYHDGTCHHHDVGDAYLEVVLDALVHDEQGDGDTYTQGGHEECAAQTGDAVLVYFAGIGKVEQSSAVAEFDYQWCPYQRENEADGKGYDNVGVVYNHVFWHFLHDKT